MPKKQSRTQPKRNTRGKGYGGNAVAAPVWAPGTSRTEVKTYVSQGSNFQLYHNTPVTMQNLPNILNQITQGAGVTQRIGNRIFLRGLRVRMVLNNKTDRPNVSYRVACTAAPVSPNADAFAELFAGGGLTGLHYRPNSLLLYDTVFPLNQGSGMENAALNKERSFNHTFEIPVNHSVVYNAGDNVATTALVVWILAYDAFGTLITDNIASVAQVTFALDFTDP